MVLFVEKNPGLTTYRLEMLEDQMDVRFMLDALDKRRDTEIKIIQVPVPIQTIKDPSSMFNSEVAENIVEEKKSKSKKK
jgi:hypothetical protein